MAPLLLTALALALVAAPRPMARLTRFRRAPRAALVVWQAVALAAVVAALAAAPAAIPLLAVNGPARSVVVAVAVAATAVMAGRLAVSGHLVGTRLRAARRRHRQLVDVLAGSADGSLRVLTHATPTAYCVPGLRQRLVLSEGLLRELPAQELEAVLAHERAHLRARHDLVLEYFTVLHRAVPAPVRSEHAMREVQLLIEVLADRAARKAVGEVALARALTRLAGGSHPTATLGAAGPATDTVARMRLLAEPDPPAWLAASMYLFAGVVVAVPVALLAWSLTDR